MPPGRVILNYFQELRSNFLLGVKRPQLGTWPRGQSRGSSIFLVPLLQRGQKPAAPRDSSKDSEEHLGWRGQVIPSETLLAR